MTKISVRHQKQVGWWAETSLGGRVMFGRGDTEEMAIHNLWAEIDKLFWEVLELKDEAFRMATEAGNRDPKRDQ